MSDTNVLVPFGADDESVYSLMNVEAWKKAFDVTPRYIWMFFFNFFTPQDTHKNMILLDDVFRKEKQNVININNESQPDVVFGV